MAGAPPDMAALMMAMGMGCMGHPALPGPCPAVHPVMAMGYPPATHMMGKGKGLLPTMGSYPGGAPLGQGLLPGLAGMPLCRDQAGSGALASEPAEPALRSVGHDGTLQGATRAFVKRHLLDVQYAGKIEAHMKDKEIGRWQEELDRLDKEIDGVPPALRPNVLLVSLGTVVPQKWTDYDDPDPEPQERRPPNPSSSRGGSGGFQSSALGRRMAEAKANASCSGSGAGRERGARERSRSRSRDRRSRSRERRRRSRSPRSRSRRREKER